jgi:hypothetical protein
MLSGPTASPTAPTPAQRACGTRGGRGAAVFIMLAANHQELDQWPTTLKRKLAAVSRKT